MRESTPALWIRLSLAYEGEKGWAEAHDSDPEHGSVVLAKGEERIVYGHKFNGGNPMWFCREAPRWMYLAEVLPDPFEFRVQRQEEARR